MSAVTQKISLAEFRETYADRKPYFELLDGEPVQKSLPTRLHSILQLVLLLVLTEFGFKPRPELTMAIGESWEPTPDVCGVLGPEEGVYPTRPIALAIEILSPEDRMSRVLQKCAKYAEWGIPDILVFDPVERAAWFFDCAAHELVQIEENYAFASKEARLSLTEVFARFEAELR